ncbi:MAG: AbrB/MazE/SpoVT family DNA-binding domain-containing protein [Candidatus Bipolaricaulota bacterium]|nr:AbrB/MazE/SpoVT family DNA-binding domain-containing protein [Candidatus Bipolaricaulota bacterium]MDW8031856.1 AbrB/MazE/SpoVT family DNA-binding domain-containing protein [Candidatus Bipolaricaulota bacterium]
MAKLVKVGSKGQVTLPKEIREDLNLRAGDVLELEKLEQGRYVIAKHTPLRQLAQALEQEARRRGYTEQDLRKSIAQARQQLWQELVAQARKPQCLKKK